MPTRKTKLQLAALAILVLGALLFADYWSRCHAAPLSREEALRSNVRLQHLLQDWALGDSLPVLVEEQFEPKDGSWALTFRNRSCEVIIITDRRKGTDVGGMSKGCTIPRTDRR
jgi:hypothetical protein